MPEPASARVHPTVERLAAYGWRLLVLAAVLVGMLWLLGQLWVVLLAGVIATYLARGLEPATRRLRERRVPRGLAALVVLLGFLGVVGVGIWALVPQVADEFSTLGPTVDEAIADVEDWLVEDSPFDISRADIEQFRAELGDTIGNSVRSSGDGIVSGALVAVEVLTGVVLALIATFFFLKDGARFQAWFLGHLPDGRRELATRLARRAWTTLGGYLKGVAVLGTIEGLIIGVALAVVGADLALPVGILTFAAAFVPIVGAIVAGVVAVLVTLTTAGFAAAVIVSIVALVVQQLDNDLLAPVIYGKALQLHPLVILVAVVAGGALFGFGGTVLAVPVTAVIVNLAGEARQAPSVAPAAAAASTPPGEPSSP